MFRIWCEFKPGVKRAGGGDSMGPRQGRGAWVVHIVTGLDAEGAAVKRCDRPECFTKHIGVLCPTPRRTGTRCSPRKLLEEYQAQQRLVRAVNGGTNA